MRKNKLSPEEIEEVLSKPVEIFPEPSDYAKAKGIIKRGPLGWQREAFLWEYPWEKRLEGCDTLHCHNLDCLLVYSGGGTGKTKLGSSLNAFFLTAFPGCQTLVIAQVYSDIEQIVIPGLRDLFSIKSPWDHPYVTHFPNKQDKYLDLTIPTLDENGKIIYKISRCWFGHAADWGRLRGKEYVYIHAEEISQFKESRVIDEFGRRLRSPLAPFRMLYATTNPPESMSHFLYDKWDCTDYMPDFDGDKPESRVCSCQYCPECEKLGKFEFGEDGLCSNPNCQFLEFCKKNKLPATRFKKPTWEFRGKTYSCPGEQPFWRVLHPLPEENIHNPATLSQELKAGHDEANYQVYVQGDVRALKSNKVYPAFSFAANTFPNEFRYSADMLADPTKDIIWTHDHNTRPRCAVIGQEYIQENGEIYPFALDEIVMYDTKEPKFDGKGERIRGVGPEHMAQEFIDRYQPWNQMSIQLGEQKTVDIHGDHTALNSKMSPFSRNEFQIMHDMLVAAGFLVRVCVVKVKGLTQVTQSDRIAVTNWMLRDSSGVNRVKINKRCKHLLKSLEDLEKKSKEKEEIDKNCDESARLATNTKITHLISHVSDAWGYYLMRCFNLIQDGDIIKFIYVPGGSLINIDFKTGKLSGRVPDYTEPEQPRPDKNQIDKMMLDEYLAKIQAYVSEGLANSSEHESLETFRNYFC